MLPHAGERLSRLSPLSQTQNAEMIIFPSSKSESK